MFSVFKVHTPELRHGHRDVTITTRRCDVTLHDVIALTVIVREPSVFARQRSSPVKIKGILAVFI
jgi:hypothetical protein